MLPNDTKKPGLYQLFSTNYGQIGIPDMGGLKWGKSGKNHLGYLERGISQGYKKCEFVLFIDFFDGFYETYDSTFLTCTKFQFVYVRK